jgi:hypothetical protein
MLQNFTKFHGNIRHKPENSFIFRFFSSLPAQWKDRLSAALSLLFFLIVKNLNCRVRTHLRASGASYTFPFIVAGGNMVAGCVNPILQFHQRLGTGGNTKLASFASLLVHHDSRHKGSLL